MTPTLIGSLAGLAALDALNPFSVAALAYLLSMDRPLTRGVVFVVGTAVTYLVGGLLLLYGWTQAIGHIGPLLPREAAGILEMLAGLLCLGIAFWAWGGGGGGAALVPPRDLGLPATLIFAVASTAADLPTAVPYVAGVNLIAAADTGAWAMGMMLFWYVLIYVSPLILMVVARAWSGEAATPLFDRARAATDWGLTHLFPPALLLGGIFLLVDGARRL